MHGELKGSALSLNKCIKYADGPTLLLPSQFWMLCWSSRNQYIYRSLHFPSHHMVIRISTDLLPYQLCSIALGKDRRRRSCPNSKYRWCGDEVIKSDCGTHSLQIGYLSTLLQIECKTFPMQYIYYQRFGDMGLYTNHMNWSRGRGVSKNFTLVYNPYGEIFLKSHNFGAGDTSL